MDYHDYNVPPQTYRGVSVLRERPHYLYEIGPRAGYDLRPMLSGKFTKLETLQTQIDSFFKEFPSASANSAYVERTTKRGRGRPKKTRLQRRAPQGK